MCLHMHNFRLDTPSLSIVDQHRGLQAYHNGHHHSVSQTNFGLMVDRGIPQTHGCPSVCPFKWQDLGNSEYRLF